MTDTQPAVIAPEFAELDGALEAAMADADVPVLLMVLHHLTGNDRWLRPPYLPVSERRLFADPSGGLSAELQAEVRAATVEAVAAFHRGELEPAAPPEVAGVTRMLSVCVGEPVPEEYAPLALEEMGFTDREVRWRRRPDQAVLDAFSVIVIGAGQGGLCAAIKLLALGINCTVVEKNPDVGGTWFENTYPNCGVDVPNHFYSYSFEPNHDWPGYFSKRDELHQYLRRCAAKYGVLEHTRFETTVTRAEYDPQRRRWVVDVETADGRRDRLEANAVISAVGQLNRPKIPDLPGRDDFAGQAFHSAQWRHDVDLAGQRVAVIGTGASAGQLVPALAEHAGQLTVFQRTAQWVVPNPDYHRRVSDAKKWLLRHVPYYAGWYRFSLFWRVGDALWPSLQVDPDWPHRDRSINALNDRQRELLTRYMTRTLSDRPDLLDKALPRYPPYSKRLMVDSHWFAALRRDSVELVTEPIERVTPGGIRTADGREIPFDVIVFATGFHASKLLWPMHVRGAGGRTLADVWDGDDPRAYLGITVPEFPNLFCLYGPNTNLGHGGSIIFHTECQVRYVLGCLRELLERGAETMEVRPEVHDEYNERLDAAIGRMIWAGVDVDSWFKNSKQRVVANSPWRLVDYWAMTKELDPADFEFTARP
jgi:4-hydroxyacetophenone monooxygenase